MLRKFTADSDPLDRVEQSAGRNLFTRPHPSEHFNLRDDRAHNPLASPNRIRHCSHCGLMTTRMVDKHGGIDQDRHGAAKRWAIPRRRPST